MSQHEISTEEIASGLREFFADHPVFSAVRRRLDDVSLPAWDPDAWTTLATQLGVAGLVVDGEHGGLGLGVSAAVAAAYEAGVGLYPGPLRSTLIASLILQAAPSVERIHALLSQIAEGHATATAVLDLEPAAVTLNGDRLSGHAGVVADACEVDVVVVPVTDGQGSTRLAVLRSDVPGVHVRELDGTDASHTYASINFDDAEADVVAIDSGALADAYDAAQLIVAAEQAGGTAGCLRLAADYAKTRTQFRVPIATFQAISHRCAELAVDLEGVRGLVQMGARAADAGERGQLRALAPLARASATDAFLAAAETLIQVHGGIGFTWEHDAHLYFRRAHSMRAWFGTPDQLRLQAMRAHAIELITI